MSTHFFGLKNWTFAYSHSIGRNEFAGKGFRFPMDLALASEDLIYVVNRSREDRTDGVRITVCTHNEEYISEFGSSGEGDGQFIWPTAIALDGEENVYVADEWLNRITVFSKDGEFIRNWGKAGSGNGELNGPSGLAISDGTLFLVDSRNHRVQKFTLDGRYRGQFGSFGSGPGQLNLPWGIGLDKDGQVFVADWRNDRIQQFTSDGEHQATFGGRRGSGVGQFNRPTGVAVDKDGEIYIADRWNHRVQVLAPDGRFVTEFTGDHVLSQWGIEKLQSNPDMILQRSLVRDMSFEKRLSNPCAVKVDDQYRIAVVDPDRGRIQVYKKLKEPVLA